MLTFTDFTKILSYNSDGNFCIEIEFKITDSTEFTSCFMGKTCNKNDVEYWYGLTADGSNAYEYDSLESFISAPVFCSKTLSEIWDKIEILSIDGCDPEERISFYIS